MKLACLAQVVERPRPVIHVDWGPAGAAGACQLSNPALVIRGGARPSKTVGRKTIHRLIKCPQPALNGLYSSRPVGGLLPCCATVAMPGMPCRRRRFSGAFAVGEYLDNLGPAHAPFGVCQALSRRHCQSWIIRERIPHKAEILPSVSQDA